MLLFAAADTADAGDVDPIATAGVDRIAIKGYDVVAYFTDSKAIEGSNAFEYVWNDARWRFASLAHRDMFITDPDRYAPQFGGFCAGAIINQVLVPANPESWAIVDGKLYMVAGTHEDIAEWKADATENIQRGDKQWVVRERWAQTQQ